jgi:hypothetical protein
MLSVMITFNVLLRDASCIAVLTLIPSHESACAQDALHSAAAISVATEQSTRCCGNHAISSTHV